MFKNTRLITTQKLSKMVVKIVVNIFKRDLLYVKHELTTKTNQKGIHGIEREIERT